MSTIFTFLGIVFLLLLTFVAGYFIGRQRATNQLMDKYYLIPQDKQEFRVLLKQLRQMYSEIRKNNSKLNRSAQKLAEKTNRLQS